MFLVTQRLLVRILIENNDHELLLARGRSDRKKGRAFTLSSSNSKSLYIPVNCRNDLVMVGSETVKDLLTL
jgi:hypothetical protein